MGPDKFLALTIRRTWDDIIIVEIFDLAQMLMYRFLHRLKMFIFLLADFRM